MFEIKNVSKQFGSEYALRDISMTIGGGLNFIIGSSGSGKTTLLKIISGMEQNFDGEVLYCDQNIKTLNEYDKSYFYNNIFGFIWQDFNLLDDLTVLENIMLPQYLKKGTNEKAVMKLLRDLKISELADQKAGKLSGGQKQRVAIARELIKNPKVIIADEPTSALDEKSAKTIINILRDIAKSRIVIVVTHDTSLIDANSKVYELDKGELISVPNDIQTKTVQLEMKAEHKLPFKNACQLSLTNIKSKFGRFAVTILSLLVSSVLLLVTVSGAITDSSQDVFKKLFDTYGQSILDISIVKSFTSAASTDGKKNEEPNADVTQNIEGLYEKYSSDERISHIVSMQAYNDITITIDGKNYKVESSGSTPSVNELTEGVMPMGNENEVVVPQSFVKKLGISDKDAIGKTIEFKGAVYNWDSGEPVLMPVNTTAKIVGIADTTTKYEWGKEIIEYTVDDSFFFSKSAIDEMREQAKLKKGVDNFSIRAKTPADLIALKDELNAGGIVPIGRFELVEDMVRLNEQTTEQSGSAIIVIGILSVTVIIAVSMITALLRKREYAVYKISGYSGTHITVMMISEFLIASSLTAALFMITSPLTNIATASFWNVSIINGRLLGTGTLLIFILGILSCAINAVVGTTTKTIDSLQSGDR